MLEENEKLSIFSKGILETYDSDHIEKMMPDLIKAQAMMKGPVKKSKNPYHKSEYADLSEVVESCQHALNSNNIFFEQPTVIINQNYYVMTRFVHVSGQWKRSFYPLFFAKQDPQSVGSTITYARRYSLQNALGLAPINKEDDDDGESAMELDNEQIKFIIELEKEDPKFCDTMRIKFQAKDLKEISRTQFDLMKSHVMKIKEERKNGKAAVA